MAKMTINQYITNPQLRGGRVMSGMMRESVRKNYTDRFYKLNLRENNKWTYTMYIDEENNEYYIHIKMPSETIKDFYYDVVFKFFVDENVKNVGTSLLNYYFQCFSNDPAFCYTYAYVFYNNDLIVPALKSRVSKLAKNDRPEVTNPTENTGYVKSLYFAYLLMKNRGLFNTLTWGNAIEYNKDDLLNSVEDMNSKVSKREDEQKRLNERNKRKKETKESIAKHHTNRLSANEKKNIVRKTKVIKNTTKSVKSVKSKASKKSKIIK